MENSWLVGFGDVGTRLILWPGKYQEGGPREKC